MGIDLLESQETINASIDHFRQEAGALGQQLIELAYSRIGALGTDLIGRAFDRLDASIRLAFDRLENLSLTIPGITFGIPATTIRLSGKAGTKR